MSAFRDIIFFIITFFSVYVQVFYLVTFFRYQNKILRRTGKVYLKEYPAVTIIVPCYAEEKTVEKTVHSLQELRYPKDKLHIILIDDGSPDNTWKKLQQLEKQYTNIRSFTKQNGGKHTCLNFGLDNTKTLYVGCLDADSLVHPEALVRIMSYFELNSKLMAVTPTLVVHNPKSLVQRAQRAEYNVGTYNKKMMGFLGGIHVTPGPFSIFKKEVFDTIGQYKKAHNTEDMEITFRMHRQGYLIDNCSDAYVYTLGPKTIYDLYRQRVRWIYGFMKNIIDYKELFFKRKYGTLGFFTLPAGLISIIAVIFMIFFIIQGLIRPIYSFFERIFIVGFDASFSNFLQMPSFDWFYINTETVALVAFVLYTLVLSSFVLGKWVSSNRETNLLDAVIFFGLYSVIAPIWLMKAIWNVLISREDSWTVEIDKRVRENL